MTRRVLVFICLLPAVFLPAVLIEAQQPAKVPRIGFLNAATPSAILARYEAFQQGLRELGYVEGKSIVTEYRYADGKLDRLRELAATNRLPAIYGQSHFVVAGGLMSYGASVPDMLRRSAVYVDKILKGTKAAELPVQQAMKFEMLINLKAAKQIGLTIAQNVLARADRVIR